MIYIVKIDGKETNRYTNDRQKAEEKAAELNDKLMQYGQEAYVESEVDR